MPFLNREATTAADQEASTSAGRLESVIKSAPAIDTDSDECQFVQAIKPPHLRTPEYVSLNSEDEDSDVVFVNELPPMVIPDDVVDPPVSDQISNVRFPIRPASSRSTVLATKSCCSSSSGEFAEARLMTAVRQPSVFRVRCKDLSGYFFVSKMGSTKKGKCVRVRVSERPKRYKWYVPAAFATAAGSKSNNCKNDIRTAANQKLKDLTLQWHSTFCKCMICVPCKF